MHFTTKHLMSNLSIKRKSEYSVDFSLMNVL